MAKYSFNLQIFLLNKRFKQQQQIVWAGTGGVQDRTIYEDAVFARMLRDSGLMTARDFNCYMELFNNMSNFMKKPNIIVHLEVSPEESLRRIKARSRGCETGITLKYLEDLHAAYEAFLADIARVIPVIKVDYSRFHSVDEMARVVKEEYEKIGCVLYSSGVGVIESDGVCWSFDLFRLPHLFPFPPIHLHILVYLHSRNIRTVSAERLVRRAMPKSPNPLAVDEHVEAEEKGEKIATASDNEIAETGEVGI